MTDKLKKITRFDSLSSGALLYFGTSHSRDPKHPQIAKITAEWTAFQPTVAFYEGRSRGYFYGSVIEPFAGLPEPALWLLNC